MGPEPSGESQAFLAAELNVELQSASLKKELRLRDLVGIQLLNTVGLFWIGTAGKVGASHALYWIPAVLLFYVPSGIVVAHLAQEMPIEGGLYQWAKLRFSPLIGFLVALDLWVLYMAVIANLGVTVADAVSHAFGPSAAWIPSSQPMVIGIGLVCIAALVGLCRVGMTAGKWANNVGGFAILALFATIVAVALPHWFRGDGAATPVGFSAPPVSLLSLNLLGKMGFGALAGFDGVAVFAGECRADDVTKPIRASIWIATPIISSLFVAGTAAVLTFSTPDKIDLVAPIGQIVRLGAPNLALAAGIGVIGITVAGAGLALTILTRLPMVAGWDHLLPSWFSELHPKYKTPAAATLFAGAVAGVATILVNLGTGAQESFQVVTNAGGICYALAYLAMFAVPLFAPGEKPPLFVRAAALSGFLMTLLYTVLSAFPIIDVANPAVFFAKVAGTVVVVHVAGVAYYYRRIPRSVR